jgi:2-oxoglutarate dehydrogenase E2 component (dihydrolipoamide succinyltransferase)
MALELKVPSVGESITEVQIGDWLVKEGMSADKEQAVVVIETDKVTVELPAPAAGTVTKMLKKKGDKALVGEVIGYLEAGVVAAKPSPVAAAVPAAAAATPASAPAKPAAAAASGETRVMPSAARALHEAGLAPGDVPATGPGGRLLKEDVQRAVKSGVKPAGARQEEIVPMTPMRRRIAERLVEAQNTAAMLTTFNEIDMTAVMALRKEHQEAFTKRHGVKLGFMSFFVRASIEALKQIPQVNAEIRGESIVYKNYQDVGIAVGGGKGLVVPILRNAERMSFADIEKAIAEYGTRAQANKLTLDELTGGTFTISNGGIYGSLLSTPILNPPQSGILGMHAIKRRPVEDPKNPGQVVIRPMMYLAFSYDHRIIDGTEAVNFLVHIKECIEKPERLMLGV